MEQHIAFCGLAAAEKYLENGQYIICVFSDCFTLSPSPFKRIQLSFFRHPFNTSNSKNVILTTTPTQSPLSSPPQPRHPRFHWPPRNSLPRQLLPRPINPAFHLPIPRLQPHHHRRLFPHYNKPKSHSFTRYRYPYSLCQPREF